MGGQISVPQGAKPEQLDLYGVFDLRQRQKFSITVLSDLVTMLVDGNNLFNLAEVYNSPEGCNSLFTIIQKKLDKEFMTLQLPDPQRGSDISKVSFMPKTYYEKILKSDEERKDYCRQFTRFIVRFTGLVAALTASVALQPNAYIRLKDVSPQNIQSSSSRNPSYRDLANKQLTYRAIPDKIVNVLKAGKLRQIFGDTRQLYTFNPSDPIVLDIQRGIVYNAQMSPTGVFGITITENTSSAPVMEAPLQPQMRLYMPAPAPVPAPVVPARPASSAQGWNAASSSTAYRPTFLNSGGIAGSIRGGATRRQQQRQRQQRQRKGTRRQRGGAPAYFDVTLSNVGECVGDTCQLYKFSIDSDGNAYSTGSPFPEPFSAKVQKYLAYAPKFNLDAGSGTGSTLDTAYVRDTALTAKPELLTLDKLNLYKSAIRGITDDNQPINPKNVTSPAFYRAFLLATGVRGADVTTTFCTDVWTGSPMDTIPYALLQSLYYDSRDNSVNESLTELNNKASEFIGNNIALAVKDAAPALGFAQLKFIDPKTIAKGFCEAGNRIANSSEQYNILTNAHRKLRNLYDTHLANVERFVRKILSLKDMGYRKAHQIRIDPIFVTNSKGALETLEEFIKEARTLLADHYLEVEMVYKTAIRDIAKIGMGVVPDSAKETNAPALRTKNVNNAKTSFNPLERGIIGKNENSKMY
jgi:hypothetical protein